MWFLMEASNSKFYLRCNYYIEENMKKYEVETIIQLVNTCHIKTLCKIEEVNNVSCVST